ncbi:MAG: hypothetical protein ACQGVC_03415 [Myxococcota bacterium]
MIVAERLGPLRERVVFLGGAATNLLITDEAAPETGMTPDVDLVIEIGSSADFYALEDELRALGFRNDPDGPVCRWIIDGIPVDVMPTDEGILGFANTWSAAAIEHADEIEIEAGVRVRLVPPVYFLATKLEAFAGRGEGDLRGSKDIEDIVAVLDGRPELVDEVAGAPEDVGRFVAECFASLLSSPPFEEAVAGHLPGDRISQARATLVLERMKAIAGSKEEPG